jgi:hypothetical protein
MSKSLHRRTFLTGVASLARIATSQDERSIGVGIVGAGNRGTSLLRTLLALPGVEVPAICDINEANLARAQGIVEKAGRQRPEGYSSGVEDFRRLAVREDLNAIIIGTPWDLHTPVAIAAMKAGKYAGVEVPAALTIEDCWELVNTSEKTGMPCMMLENVCYFRNVLMVLNLVRQGLLGELLHCEVGYQHFVRGSQFTKDGDFDMACDARAGAQRESLPNPCNRPGGVVDEHQSRRPLHVLEFDEQQIARTKSVCH